MLGFCVLVCPLQETILPLHDDGEGYSAGDLRHTGELSHIKSGIIRAQHTAPCCVSLQFCVAKAANEVTNYSNTKMLRIWIKCEVVTTTEYWYSIFLKVSTEISRYQLVSSPVKRYLHFDFYIQI